jgi:hypothetical protein
VAVDDHRQHQALVVVGVLADQIDAAGGPRHHRGGGVAEELREELGRAFHYQNTA